MGNNVKAKIKTKKAIKKPEKKVVKRKQILIDSERLNNIIVKLDKVLEAENLSLFEARFAIKYLGEYLDMSEKARVEQENIKIFLKKIKGGATGCDCEDHTDKMVT